MMRQRIVFIAAALFLVWSISNAFAAGVGEEEVKKDLQKFQGTWVMVSGEKDGKKVADEHVSRSKITIEDKKMVLVVPNQTGEDIVADIVKIDATKSPREMHFIRRNGPSAGKTIVAIYEFEGGDQYKIAFDPAAASTLKEFVTKEGTGHIRNSWKRVKQ